MHSAPSSRLCLGATPEADLGPDTVLKRPLSGCLYCSSCPLPWVTQRNPLTELTGVHSFLLSLNCHQGDGTSAATPQASKAAGRKGVSSFCLASLLTEGRIQKNSHPIMTTDLTASLYFRI